MKIKELLPLYPFTLISRYEWNCAFTRHDQALFTKLEICHIKMNLYSIDSQQLCVSEQYDRSLPCMHINIWLLRNITYK